VGRVEATQLAGLAPEYDLLIGALIIVAITLKHTLERVHVPPLAGFILIGVGLSTARAEWGLLSAEAEAVFAFLSSVGVIFLLFRVGLESDLHGLTEKFPKALPVWFGDVAFSGALGYIAARHVLGFELVPSLIAAVALTATSGAIALESCRHVAWARPSEKNLLLDVVELDDFSGVLLMVLVLAAAPLLATGDTGSVGPLVAASLIWFLVKAGAFGLACVGLAWLVPPFFRHVMDRRDRVEPMLVVIGIVIAMAALSEILGFSLALGAFFAGLIFCRVPEAVKNETIFLPLYGFFTPFFFIYIGLQIDLDMLVSALHAGIVLLAAAIIGKVAGAYVPARYDLPPARALLLGASLIPRAEISMVVVLQGQALGTWAVPPSLNAAVVLVVLATSVVTPLAMRFGAGALFPR